MTTNLYAIAGPSNPSSNHSSPSPSEHPSPLKTLTTLPPNSSLAITKPGLSVEENGEILKVPAFLNKLYTMVSDPEVDELIYWGKNGDSFFVPNAEHFGRELLPRWFKHSNFSSFVRQLNMYGFHKVPHLQSGALKNETPLELWEFANPYFKRNQPQLLAKVTRKNNRPPGLPGAVNTRSTSTAQASTSTDMSKTAVGGKYLITDGTSEGEAGQLIPGGNVDLQAIHNGIAAIRQTQANISTDLRKLQASNEALWRQAYETQEKQRKHEETIDLIVSFLERLFGTEGEGLKGLKEAMRRGVGGRPKEGSHEEEDLGTGSAKKRRRVGLDRMIEGKADEDDDQLVEISSHYPRPSHSSPSLSEETRFQTLPSEDSPLPSLQQSSVTPYSLNVNKNDLTLGTNAPPPLSNTDHLLPTSSNALAPYGAYQHQPLLSPGSAESAAAAYNIDPSLLQTTIGQLLQNPAAAQMFLNSLSSSTQGQALSLMSTPRRSGNTFANNSGGLSDGIGIEMGDRDDPTLALFSPLPHTPTNNQTLPSQPEILQQNPDFFNSYQCANNVSREADILQEGIDDLVRSMGLNLPIDSHTGVSSNSDPSAVPVGMEEGIKGESDFNMDEFFEGLAKDDVITIPGELIPGSALQSIDAREVDLKSKEEDQEIRRSQVLRCLYETIVGVGGKAIEYGEIRHIALQNKCIIESSHHIFKNYRPFLLSLGFSAVLPLRSSSFFSSTSKSMSDAECTKYLFRKPSSAAPRESPWPLIFLRARGLGGEEDGEWRDWSGMFAEKGYTAIEIDITAPLSSENTFVQMSTALSSQIRLSAIPFPPIIIARGKSTLLAQAYIEDFPASGLVLLDPLSDDDTRDARTKKIGSENGWQWPKFKYEPLFPILLITSAERMNELSTSNRLVREYAENDLHKSVWAMRKADKGKSVNLVVTDDLKEELDEKARIEVERWMDGNGF
ncbi:hypothetical protein L204_104727 [Cryptococcus depauperatus]